MKWLAGLAAALLMAGSATAGDRPARKAEPAFTSLTGEFEVFADATATMPEGERVKLFRRRFDALFPGFYEPRGRDEAQYDAQIARSLRDFPAIRTKY